MKKRNTQGSQQLLDDFQEFQLYNNRQYFISSTKSVFMMSQADQGIKFSVTIIVFVIKQKRIFSKNFQGWNS